MNYADIKTMDVGDGPGIRVSLFVSGCSHYCKGCFNSEAWDYNYGNPYTYDVEAKIMKLVEPSYVAGLTILGGEPCDPKNVETVYNLCSRIKNLYGDKKSVWVYTGYTFEQLYRNYCGIYGIRLLKTIDVLVDGKFNEDLHNDTLKFKGSSNQRIIKVPETMEKISIASMIDDNINHIVLWE